MKSAAVHSRINPEIKEQAEGILQRLGLSPTEAIRMFYTQIALRNGLPFDVAIPNDATVKALEDSRNGRNLERFDVGLLNGGNTPMSSTLGQRVKTSSGTRRKV